MLGPNALRAPRGSSCLSSLRALGASPLPLPLPPATAAPFSTTVPSCQRKTKDRNKKRGVSSLYGSGPREPLSMSDMPLPKPRAFRPTVAVDESHGLWGFFPAPGKLMLQPSETEQHGRSWAVEELRKKSWEDLHGLWWTCCRERNMLATSKAELERAEMGFGQREIETRDEEVMKTMRAIKHALTERYYTWQDAFEVAKSDPEINLEGGEGKVYTPAAYEAAYEEVGESWGEAEKGSANADADADADATGREDAVPSGGVSGTTEGHPAVGQENVLR